MAKPARKYSQAGRVHDVIRLLEARHGITVEELAEETRVDRRTVYRDLAAVEEAGYPLISEWCEGKKVYRFLERFRDVPPIAFSLQELMTLSLLRSRLSPPKGTPFHDDVESVFRKIHSSLPPRQAAHLDRITSSVVPVIQGERDYSRSGKILKTIREALLFQYRLALDYDPRGSGAARYDVDPYTLILYKGGLYLLGHAHNRQALRTFAVERIVAAERGTERFEVPEGFRADRHLREAFGIVEEKPFEVVVRFFPEVAHSVRGRVWHASQQVREEEGGGFLLTCEAGGRLEILSWVLSYGRHAELLAPPELREELRRHAAEMAEVYGA